MNPINWIGAKLLCSIVVLIKQFHSKWNSHETTLWLARRTIKTMWLCCNMHHHTKYMRVPLPCMDMKPLYQFHHCPWCTGRHCPSIRHCSPGSPTSSSSPPGFAHSGTPAYLSCGNADLPENQSKVKESVQNTVTNYGSSTQTDKTGRLLLIST